ncbi:MAG: SMC-Scp complex subunit ScpB [Candidatus Edwardsbacteria bacterium]
MNRNEVKRVIEALLFASDLPLSLAKLKNLLGEIDPKNLKELMLEINQDYEREGHSFEIREIGGGFQIYTRPEYAKWIHELYKGRKPPRLTHAALETLAIIAYKQPVTRADIEVIRGVNVDSVIATLLERNLITMVGKDKRPGRPLLYGTTSEFLRYFGLNSISDLPKIEELEAFLKKKEEEQEKDEPLPQIKSGGEQLEAELM